MLEKGRISAAQMAMMLYATVVGTVILAVPSITAKHAKNDMWLSPAWASLSGFVAVLVAFWLHKMCPGLTLIQYVERIIGRIPGKVLGFGYLIFYLIMNGHGVRIYADFMVGAFLPNTPLSFVIASIMLVCTCAVHGGVEGIGRAAQLIVPFYILALFGLIVLLLPDMEADRFLPVFEHGLLPSIKGAYTPQGWFAEFMLLSFLLPYLSKAGSGKKWGLLSVLVVTVTLIVTNLAVLLLFGGGNIPSYTYPLLSASRYISFADFFENIEAAIIAIWVMGNFVKFSVIHYCLVLGTAQWLNMTDYRPLVFPLGIFTVLLSYWSLRSQMSLIQYTSLIFPAYSLLFQTFIPVVLLFIALMRKRKLKGETSR